MFRIQAGFPASTARLVCPIQPTQAPPKSLFFFFSFSQLFEWRRKRIWYLAIILWPAIQPASHISMAMQHALRKKEKEEEEEEKKSDLLRTRPTQCKMCWELCMYVHTVAALCILFSVPVCMSASSRSKQLRYSCMGALATNYTTKPGQHENTVRVELAEQLIYQNPIYRTTLKIATIVCG